MTVPLQDQGGAKGEPDATRALRTSPTRRVANAAEDANVALAGQVAGGMASPSSLPLLEHDWEDESDGEGSGDERKDALEAATPTLVDEPDFLDEDEEQEMANYERDRLLRNTRQLFDNPVRRTPGAQMYRSQFQQESIRRTPGAEEVNMPYEPANLAMDSGIGDVSGLGFGLTLSTPVASRGKTRPVDMHSSLESASSGVSNRPPLPKSSLERDTFASPLFRTNSSNRAFSPNTMRITEDMENLLFEDDDAHEAESGASEIEGLDSSTKQTSESWTTPYVMSMDGPRVPRSSTRGRRTKSDGSRRLRAQDRLFGGPRPQESNLNTKTGGFLHDAEHPKPVRNVPSDNFQHGISQTAPHIVFGFQPQNMPLPSMPGHGSQAHLGTGTGTSTQLFSNFGGAFAPPLKPQASAAFPAQKAHNPPAAPNFHQQHPYRTQDEQQHVEPPTFFQPVSTEPVFAPAETHFSPFQNTFHHPNQPQFGASSHKFQPQFGSQPFLFGNNPNSIHPSPTFNMPHGYQMHHHPMHPPPPQEFVPIMQPPQQQWAQPMSYDGIASPLDHAANWHGGGGGSPWVMGEFGYAMNPQQSMHSNSSPAPASLSSTPPVWFPEQIIPSEQSASAAAPSPAHLAPSPAPSIKGKKTTRKTTKKSPKTSKSDKSIASQKSEPSSGPAPTFKKGKKKSSKSNSLAEGVSHLSSEDNNDRKNEQDETPETKAAFKEFSKKLRAEERSSFEAAHSFALKALSDKSLPELMHWRMYLELADLAKRANRFNEARKLYQKVCRLRPHTIQGWLEFSKLEEDCGNMNICAKILRAGIECCDYNDGLYARAIKHEEKMGNISRARELLSRLKLMGIENVWRTVLEGALLEARTGNHTMARRVLKYLMHHVPWYGPLYLEAYKLEKNLGRSREALEVVERGLRAIPRYGPLWFGAFKLCEELDQNTEMYALPRTMIMIDRATLCVSKEIIWKVHLEAAQMLERSATEFLDLDTDPSVEIVMNMSRRRYVMTILSCPPNLRWKVWLAAGRMEISAGNTDRARQLFLRAHKVVPDKGRAVALLECARLEEYVGDINLAKAILCKSRSVSGSDWKVWLESVLLEIRCGDRARAVELARFALKLHSGTGRLWASLVQLYHYEGGEAKQFETLRYALNAVPKSGEVWCEGARVHLNPFSHSFDLSSAERHLSFATKFTPQYGDGFLETLRLEIIIQWLVPIAKLVWELTKKDLDFSEGMSQAIALARYVRKISAAVFLVCKSDSEESFDDLAITKGLARMIRGRLKPGFRDSTVDLVELRQRCANADPNYGLLWFHCRETPSGTARQVFTKATKLMKNDIGMYAHIYISALVRHLAILTQLDRTLEVERQGKTEKKGKAPSMVHLSTQLEEGQLLVSYLSAPSLEEILHPRHNESNNDTEMVLLESTTTSSRFVTGLLEVSSPRQSESQLSTAMDEKRKVLFGTDALFS